jgi:hypothetical protein
MALTVGEGLINGDRHLAIARNARQPLQLGVNEIPRA